MVDIRHSNKNKPHILYFLRGMVPTPAETQDAATYGNVAFRNANFINDTDAIEPNDGVCGAVPKVYLKFGCEAAPRIMQAAKQPEPAAQPKVSPGRKNETKGNWGTR